MFILNSRRRIQELKTDLEEAQAKIREIQKQNNALMSILISMVEGVISVDKDTRIVSLNPAAEKIFGIRKEEAQGKFLLEAIRNNDIAEIITSVFRANRVISREITLVWPMQKVFSINASPILEEDLLSGCLLVIHDITEIRRLERMRSDFVANVSHELKTPLTSIKGFVETLLEEAFEDRANSINFLKIIHEHTDRINRIINDLLELSSLESKGISLEKEVFALRPFMEEIIAGLKMQFKGKMLKLELNIGPEIDINADKDNLRQVFLNLLSNAIKFNKENGTIKVYAEKADEFIKIIVEDSGIGIPEKDIPRIFERFYRVDKARSRQMGGTGLGLSIVRHIVELHGGRVGVESLEGAGSKFWFTLPTEPPIDNGYIGSS